MMTTMTMTMMKKQIVVTGAMGQRCEYARARRILHRRNGRRRTRNAMIFNRNGNRNSSDENELNRAKEDGNETNRSESDKFLDRMKPFKFTQQKKKTMMRTSYYDESVLQLPAALSKTPRVVLNYSTVLIGIAATSCCCFFIAMMKIYKKTRKSEFVRDIKKQLNRLKEFYRYAKETMKMKPKITRTSSRDPKFQQLLKDYAKLIHDLYDVPIVPEFIETRVYAEALQQGLEGAFETLDDIVLSGDARVLGHPIVVQRKFVGEDSERLKKYGALEESREGELEKFVADVVAIDNSTSTSTSQKNKTTTSLLSLQKMEKKMSKKILSIAARTGTLFLESGVQSFSARIFDAEFFFDVRENDQNGISGGENKEEIDDISIMRKRREALQRSRAIQIAKSASDERLSKVIEELELPPIGLIFPELEKDVARLIIAMACNTIDSEVSLPNVDYAVKFNLRVKDQKEYEEDVKKQSFSENSLRMDDAEELANAIADDFMTRRKAIAPMFVTPELERKTYRDIIKGILGGIGLNAPTIIAEFLAMDVTVQVIRKKNADKRERKEIKKDDNEGENNDDTSTTFAIPMFLRERFNIVPLSMTTKKQKQTTTMIEQRQQKQQTSNAISRESIEAFIDWLLADSAYNVQAIPDDVERTLYANCFELFLETFVETTQKVEFSILGRTVKIKTRVASDAPRDYAKIRRFRPDWQALDTIIEETKIEPEALKKITSNVHAFALAFISQILDDASAVICGHELKLALTTPTVLRKSYDFDDASDTNGSITKSSDGMSFASSASLKPKIRGGDRVYFSAMAALNALASELAIEASSAINSSKEGKQKSGGSDFSLDSIFADLQRDLQKQIASFGFIRNVSRDLDVISHDAVAFSVFKKYCSPPDENFPFPYLTKEQFEVAATEVIKMSGFRSVSLQIREKMRALAIAADEDENGVIQWGEWFTVSDAIITAVEKAKVVK